MKKILKCLIYLIITVASIITIVEFELKNIPVGSSIGGLIAGLVLGPLKDSFIDITDNTDWKTSQSIVVQLSRQKSKLFIMN